MWADLKTTNFLGFEFADATYQQVADQLDRLSVEPRISLVVTANVDHIVMLLSDGAEDRDRSRFTHAYNGATLRLCDSRVLQALARYRGVKLRVVTGSDLTALLFNDGWLDRRKVALIGGDVEMLNDLRARYPKVDVSQHIPPMGILNNEAGIVAIEEFLERQQWNYILFAMGAPRSEIIAHRVMVRGAAQGVAICIGASIEFLLGRKARAPLWMQQARLEWAFRLIREPRRLWRRYLVKGPQILSIVMNWRK